ncbi:MAG TPA: GGDEF domain-containing protein [Aquabacterium sp.]|nr:GGDEF domain-containing protein [Aquabacterium sp.]
MNALLDRVLGWSPGSVESQAEIFLRTMSVVAVIAGVAHAVFLVLFWYLGVAPLAWLNVLSLATYVWAVLSVRRRPLLVEAVMGVEIVLHGLAAVYLIGWGSGFHYYIILIVPIALISGGLNERDARWVQGIGGGGGALLYLWMERALPHAVPQHQLSVAVLDALRTFNLAGTLGILGLLSVVYRQLILQAEAVLRHQACTDPLTQLSNRRSVLETLRREVAAAERSGRPLALAMGDVDHFKDINDQHGHHTGDRVLQSVAKVLRGGVRQMDLVARWGGEEFLILLPGSDSTESVVVAERLRAQVAALVSTSSKGPVPVTMTFGLALMNPGESGEQLIARADQALYEGKQAGRNRVIVA